MAILKPEEMTERLNVTAKIGIKKALQKLIEFPLIEDIMQIRHVASKGLQRSLFGCFRQVLAYKCQ